MWNGSRSPAIFGILLRTIGKVLKRSDVRDGALQGSLADYRGQQFRPPSEF